MFCRIWPFFSAKIGAWLHLHRRKRRRNRRNRRCRRCRRRRKQCATGQCGGFLVAKLLLGQEETKTYLVNSYPSIHLPVYKYIYTWVSRCTSMLKPRPAGLPQAMLENNPPKGIPWHSWPPLWLFQKLWPRKCGSRKCQSKGSPEECWT